MFRVESRTVSTRFLSQLQMVRDENTGSGEKPVQVARKNLQILADGENREGSVLLGFMRILRSETGIYQVDSAYVPPLIDIHAHPALKRILSNMVELLVARSSQLSGTRRQKNQSLADFSASDVANFWLLYTINSHLPVLRHFLESSNIQPETLFSELSDMAGALTAFSSKIAPRDLPAYNHEQLAPASASSTALFELCSKQSFRVTSSRFRSSWSGILFMQHRSIRTLTFRVRVSISPSRQIFAMRI